MTFKTDAHFYDGKKYVALQNKFQGDSLVTFTASDNVPDGIYFYKTTGNGCIAINVKPVNILIEDEYSK